MAVSLNRIRRLATALGGASVLFAAANVAQADAAVTCNFTGGSLTIQSSSPLDEARIRRSGDSIVVAKGQTPVTCTGSESPTVHNTHVIAHSDNSGGESYFTIDLRGGPFAPGQVDEPGDSDEIDIQALMGSGQDRLYVWGGPADDFWRVGQTPTGVGLNLNAELEATAPDVDVDLRDAELVVLLPGDGNDRVLASGGPELSGPLSTRVEINGEGGNDRLAGGSGSDYFLDGPGNDEVSGGAGDDGIAEYGDTAAGDDTFDGGPGRDSVAWADFDGPIRVDLRLTGRQNTGAAGSDALTGIEGVSTSDGDDVLIGTDGDERLGGGDGDDLFAGLGGDDWLDGGTGSDTASYAIPPAGAREGITIDLALNGSDQPTGGAGVDRLYSVANLIGSPFRDDLRGSQGNNRFDVRDGAGDTVDCGAGSDAVVSDVEGVDTLANCESVNLDVRPDTRIEAGPPSLSSNRAPSFRFSATKPSSTFECSLDGTAFRACGATHSPGRLPDGAHVLRVRARDTLGALDLSPAQHAFSIDATAPRITRARVLRTGRLRLNLSEPATVKLTQRRCLRLRGGRCKRLGKARTVRRQAARGTSRVKLARRLAVGRYRVSVVATDPAGNSSRPLVLRVARSSS